MVGQERLRVWIKMCSLEHVKEERKDVKKCSKSVYVWIALGRGGGYGAISMGVCWHELPAPSSSFSLCHRK